MPTYTLGLQFEDKGLKALSQTGQKVTIIKQKPGGAANSTAWITFTPQEENIITWKEKYSVFASTTNIQSGAVITTTSHTNAVGGSEYVFNNSGFFNPGIPGRTLLTNYQIQNRDPNLKVQNTAMVTAGLLQGASINGNRVESPMCATAIMYNQLATFTPIEKIQIFTSSYSNNGIVISSVVGSALTVDYTTNLEAHVQYNDQSNSFVPVG